MKRFFKGLMSVSIVILVFVVNRPCQCMEHEEGLTEQEWLKIKESEEEEKRLAEEEARQIAKAEKISLEEDQHGQKRQELLRKFQEYKERIKIKPPLSLTTQYMEAGLGGPFSYSAIGTEFDKLHAIGNEVDQGFLLDTFFKSLFQYYTHEFLGFDMTYDYFDRPLATEQQAKFLELTQPEYERFRCKFSHPGIYGFQTMAEREERKAIESRECMLPNIKSIQYAINKLKENRLLQELGIAYMRQKVVVEKIWVPFESGDEKMGPLLYMHDKYANDIQIMIFHLMSQAYLQYLRLANMVLFVQGVKIIPPEIGDFLATFKPDFIDNLYYQSVLAKLPELSLPKPTGEILGEALELWGAGARMH